MSSSNGAHTALFHYDGKSRQIMRSTGEGARFSVWDDWELLQEYDTSNVKQAAYLQGADGAIKSLVNNVYYYQDKLASRTHVADGSGICWRATATIFMGRRLISTQPLNSSTP